MGRGQPAESPTAAGVAGSADADDRADDSDAVVDSPAEPAEVAAEDRPPADTEGGLAALGLAGDDAEAAAQAAEDTVGDDPQAGGELAEKPSDEA